MLSALRSIVTSLKSSSKRRIAANYGKNAALTVDSLESRQLMTFSFAAPTGFDVAAANTDKVELADLDSDGDIDMVIAGARTLTVAHNTGHGQFRIHQQLQLVDDPISHMQIVDSNGDGISDISISTNKFSYYRGFGNGAFETQATSFGVNRSSGQVLPGTPFLIADLDNNGIQDVVVNKRVRRDVASGNVDYVLGIYWNGDRPPESANDTAIHRLDLSNLADGRLLSADIDLSGSSDLATLDSRGVINVYLQSSSRSWTRQSLIGSGFTAIAVGDIDGDRRPDLVAVKKLTNEVILFRSTAGGLTATPSVMPSAGTAPIDVALQDVNGDGAEDLFVANQGIKNDGSVALPGDSVAVWLSTSNGLLGTPTSFVAGHSSLGKVHPGSLTLSDVNGDGAADAIVGHNAMRVDVSSGIFSSPDSTLVTILQGGQESTGLPDLHAVGMTSSTNRVTLYDSYAEFSLTLSVRNSGTATAPGDWAWRTGFYISKDAILDDSDHYASSQFNLNPIAPGGTAAYNTSVSLPAPDFGYWSGSGTYYILARVDSPDSVLESNESNNWGLGIGIDVLPIDVRLNRSAPVIAALSTMELWPGQTIARRSIQATDADDDAVSLSAQAVSINWHLDQKYNFRRNGSYRQNTAGMNEKWIWSDVTSGWFFITPQGQLFERTNPNGSPLTFHHVIDVSPAEHADPALLHDARRVTSYQPSAFTYGSTLIVNANALTGATTSPFAVIVTATDGERSTSEGFAVTRANSMAERLDQALNFGHRTSYQTNVLGQNEKLLSSSAGWHYITPNGQLFNYTSRKFVAQLTPVYYQHPQLLHNANVFQLDQQYGLYRDADDYALNATGRNEKWFGSSNGQRYFLLSNGDLYRWNGQSGPAAGTRVSSLASSFYTDPRLLHDAQARTMDALLGLNYRMTLLDTRSGLRFKLFTDRNGQSYRLEQDGRFIRTLSTGNEELTSVDRLYYDFPTLLGDALN